MEVSLERPKRYIPVSIERATSLLKEDALKKVLELEKKEQVLISEWNEIPSSKSDETYTIRVIEGEHNILRFSMIIHQSARNSVDMFTPDIGVYSYDIVTEKTLLDAVTKKVVVRGLTEIHNGNLNEARKFIAYADLRNSFYNKLPPFSVVDKREVVVCMTNDLNQKRIENALWTNHPAMVSMIGTLYEMLWKMSEDGGSVLQRLSNKI